MVARRATAQVPEDQAWAMVADGRKLQVATLGPDGWPHLVTMFHAVLDGRLVFWTYAKSQKIRNLERDPRITCLVEAGEEYAELRGVQINGTARILRDSADIAVVGRAVVRRLLGLDSSADLDDGVAAEVARQARKRVAVEVRPERVVGWDHRRSERPAL
jgi:PPOX class probable F420-dependent enzyme